jgi:hypothetical protein
MTNANTQIADDPAVEFIAAVGELARGKPEDIRSYFHVLDSEQVIDGTKTRVRVHWLTTDGNDRPRVNALAQRLGREVLDYCIPRDQIRAAYSDYANSGSTDEVMRLRDEAQQYFSSLDKSGEGGELLLYFLMEKGLRIPQILCKMPHKTNTNMMIHGVDGVHAAAREDGGLAVYWGESKIYTDFSSAISECFDSIAPFLLDDGGGALEQDLLLARQNINVGDIELSIRLAEFFDDDHLSAQKLEARGACLVGFEHSPFAQPFGDIDAKQVSEDTAAQIKKWSSAVQHRVTTRKLDSFEIEFFCVPLPSAAEFRAQIRAAIGIATNG